MRNTISFPTFHVIAVAICLSLSGAAFGAPSKANAAKEPKAESSPAAAAAADAAASPTAEARPFPFKNTVVSVDKSARTFRIGKKTVHQVHVLPETKLSKADETPAVFEEIIVGEEIRGSVRKRADGEYEAVSIKIGPKEQASPAPVAASPSPKAASKKKH